MEMTDRFFQVCDVTLYDLEDHLNELAADNWVLHSIHNPGTTESALPYFVVIAHRPHDWEASAKKDREKWEAEEKAEEKAAAKERLDKRSLSTVDPDWRTC